MPMAWSSSATISTSSTTRRAMLVQTSPPPVLPPPCPAAIRVQESAERRAELALDPRGAANPPLHFPAGDTHLARTGIRRGPSLGGPRVPGDGGWGSDGESSPVGQRAALHGRWRGAAEEADGAAIRPPPARNESEELALGSAGQARRDRLE